jgi:DinB superfamily
MAEHEDLLGTEHATEMGMTARLSRRQALRGGAASVAGMAWLLASGHGGANLIEQLAHLAHGKPMTAARLADILRTERAQWNALLAEVGPERMEIVGVEGEWSVKEIVAHLTWYEQAVVDGARQVMATGAFTRPGNGQEMDTRNARIASESHARPAADLLAEADTVFHQLLQIIAAIPDNVLNDAKFLGLPDEIPPWMRVANNSYLHYQQHEEAIRSWLAQHPAS